MDRQILRDWVYRFNARGPDGLKDCLAKGHPPRLSPAQQLNLAVSSRLTGIHGVVRWRRVDLQREILARFSVRYHERTVGKILKGLGFSHISPRPHHPAQNKQMLTTFANTLVPGRGAHRPERRRQWAPTGSRPRQPADQRYESAYLFGAICPMRGTGAALVMPHADAAGRTAASGSGRRRPRGTWRIEGRRGSRAVRYPAALLIDALAAAAATVSDRSLGGRALKPSFLTR